MASFRKRTKAVDAEKKECCLWQSLCLMAGHSWCTFANCSFSSTKRSKTCDGAEWAYQITWQQWRQVGVSKISDLDSIKDLSVCNSNEKVAALQRNLCFALAKIDLLSCLCLVSTRLHCLTQTLNFALGFLVYPANYNVVSVHYKSICVVIVSMRQHAAADKWRR